MILNLLSPHTHYNRINRQIEQLRIYTDFLIKWLYKNIKEKEKYLLSKVQNVKNQKTEI